LRPKRMGVWVMGEERSFRGGQGAVKAGRGDEVL
jgi:hypothetical protein